MTGPQRYRQACSPRAPLTLGLISNPLAKTNWRSVAHERLKSLMSDSTLAVSTASVERVPAAVRELLFEHGCNVLAVNGGDGTIHALVQATIQVLSEADDGDGDLPLPTFLLLNGGGMNMLARTFDTRLRGDRSARLQCVTCRLLRFMSQMVSSAMASFLALSWS